VAAAPATGRSAWAACPAVSSGPVPPIAAAVATMIVMLIRLQKIEPKIVSTRSAW